MQINEIPALQHLTPEQLESLENACEERRLAPGEVLILRGDEGGKLYFLLEGSLEVYRSETGADIKLCEMDAPSIFGELELLTEENRTANVRATSESLVLGLRHGKIEERIRAGDTAVLQVMYGISRVLACRLVSLSDKFVELESRSDPRKSRELREFRQKIFSDWST